MTAQPLQRNLAVTQLFVATHPVRCRGVLKRMLKIEFRYHGVLKRTLNRVTVVNHFILKRTCSKLVSNNFFFMLLHVFGPLIKKIKKKNDQKIFDRSFCFHYLCLCVCVCLCVCIRSTGHSFLCRKLIFGVKDPCCNS